MKLRQLPHVGTLVMEALNERGSLERGKVPVQVAPTPRFLLLTVLMTHPTSQPFYL